jgi:hypothetical protein
VRPAASDRLILAALALLTVGSVGLKGAVGVPVDATTASAPGQLELRVARLLQAQGFATAVHHYPDRSPAVLAVRGACRLSVRDASEGSSAMAIFAVDAAKVGPVSYLYDGKTYSAPPAFAMRLARLTGEIRGKLGLETSASPPLALAASPGCGGSMFRLNDLSA